MKELRCMPCLLFGLHQVVENINVKNEAGNNKNPEELRLSDRPPPCMDHKPLDAVKKNSQNQNVMIPPAVLNDTKRNSKHVGGSIIKDQISESQLRKLNNITSAAYIPAHVKAPFRTVPQLANHSSKIKSRAQQNKNVNKNKPNPNPKILSLVTPALVSTSDKTVSEKISEIQMYNDYDQATYEKSRPVVSCNENENTLCDNLLTRTGLEVLPTCQISSDALDR